MHHHNGGDGILKILALETSAKSVSAAVTDGGVVRAYTYQNTGLTHSRTLMPLVDAMLRESEQSLADMDLLAVAAGPGSFTGLRIGVSAEGAGLGGGQALLRRVHAGGHGPEPAAHGWPHRLRHGRRRNQSITPYSPPKAAAHPADPDGPSPCPAGGGACKATPPSWWWGRRRSVRRR